MGTRYKGTAEEVRALNAFIALSRATESLHARLGRSIAGSGLTPTQFGVLETIYHLGPLCVGDLGKKLLKTSGNMTLVVDNLEKRGLLRRVRESADRRFIRVELTDEGRRLIAEIFPGHVRDIVAQMEVLDAREIETLARLCKRLGKHQRRKE